MADVPPVNHRRPRQFRRVNRQLDDLTDDETRRRYRFSIENIDRLVRLLGPRLRRRTNRNCPLSPKQQVLIALRFYATGSFLQVIGDTFGVDVATVCRVVTRVTDALNLLKNVVIRFPQSDREKNVVKNGFFGMRGFPSVVGCIDGTHIRIIAPGQPDEPAYVNRKHYHSINVQASCDHRGKFTSVNACWPGSSHDSHVFRTSSLCRHLEANHQDPESGILLGDSGYPCRPFLLTPYLNPRNDKEEKFNRSHVSTRNLIERVFGMWKRKFHVLHSEVRMKPAKASRIIVACAVLYNLALVWNEPFEEVNIDPDQPQQEAYQGPMDGKGVSWRHVFSTYVYSRAIFRYRYIFLHATS